MEEDDLNMEMDLGDLEDELALEDVEEDDKESASILLERLRQIVKDRLGTVEDLSAVGPASQSLPPSSLSPTWNRGDHSADKLTEETNKKEKLRSVMVASARALAQLNTSTLDGEEGPGATQSSFEQTMAKIRTQVIEPFSRHVVDARTRQWLKEYGEMTSRLQHMNQRSKSLEAFAKVERDERKLGIDTKFGVNSLCLPSKLCRLAADLKLDFLNDLTDDGKVYLTYGEHLCLIIGYSAEQVTLAVNLTHNGKETSLVDEAQDILNSFKLDDQDRGLEILHDKIRALIRRSDLEVALGAGSLHDLKQDVERVLQTVPGSEVARVARGLELTLAPLTVCRGFLHRGKRRHQLRSCDDSTVVTQGVHDQQKIIASLTYRHDVAHPEEAAWQDRTALMLTIEPPVEMGSSWADCIFAVSKLQYARPTSAGIFSSGREDGVGGKKEGSALALLLSKVGHEPIESDALRTPPLLVTSVYIQSMKEQRRLHLLRVSVENSDDTQQKSSEQFEQNLSTIIHHIALRPDQHDDVPTIVNMISQQVQYNALVASIVHSPRIDIRDTEPREASTTSQLDTSESGENTVKRPRLGSVSLEMPSKARHKRLIMCPARREHLLKFKRTKATNELNDEGEESENEESTDMGSMAGEAVDQEHDVFVRLYTPSKIEVVHSSGELFSVTVHSIGSLTVQIGAAGKAKESDLTAVLVKTSSVPLAILLALGE